MHLIYLLPNGTISGVTCLKTKLFWVKPVKIIHLVHAQIFGKTIISYPMVCTLVILLNNGATFEIFKLSRKVLFSRGKLKRYLNESHTVKHLFYNVNSNPRSHRFSSRISILSSIINYFLHYPFVPF